MNTSRWPVRIALPLLAVSLLGAACSSPPREPPPPSIDPVANIDPLEIPYASPIEFPDTWRFTAGAEPAAGRHGMVVSTDSFASAAGLEILQAGGNAVDAAIAVQFALAVVHPAAGTIGGGGFMVARMADDTRVALDFRETAPGAASKNMFLDDAGYVTDASWIGYLASGVPGSVAGMEAAHERFGALPWPELLAPSIRLARDGFVVEKRHHEALSWSHERLSRFPATAAVFLPGGQAPAEGSTFRQPDLARTLEAISDHGGRVLPRLGRRLDRGRDAARRRPDHEGRPRRLRGRVARSDRGRVPGVDGDLHATSLVGRRHDGPDPQHRGVQGARDARLAFTGRDSPGGGSDAASLR
jgi:gamma-glutamyltranspeptidase/glutathione hydrolase